MIIKETFISPNSEEPLARIYSDEDFYILKNNILYEEIITDTNANLFNYIETSIPIPEKTVDPNLFYQQLVGNERQITFSSFNNGIIKLREVMRNLSSEDAYKLGFLCPIWAYNTQYETGDKVYYNNKLYVATDNSNGLVSPEEDIAFSEIRAPQDVIEEWNALNARSYRKNDKVKIGSHVYISLIENNTWSPIDFPAAWQLESQE